MNVPKFCKNFKVWWTLYYVVVSFIIGCFICKVDQFEIVDGVFLAASAMSGSGLATMTMAEVGITSFVLTAVLMILGSVTFMLLPTILYRRSCFKTINNSMIEHFRFKKRKLPFTKKNLRVIEESYLIYESLCVLTDIILAYYALWMLIGILGIYGALQRFPLQKELVDRGITYIDSAVYLTVSAFANAGLTMTSDSLIGIDNNPACYIIISILIIAGNTALPIFLRYFIVFLRYCNRQIIKVFPHQKNRFSVYEPYNYYFNTDTILTFILNHPRSLTTHLFHGFQTKLLILMVGQLIVIQYVCFIISIIDNKVLLEKYSLSLLMGIGYFQTLSTRSAGFAMMDLRDLNQGLLFIYFIMMYISSFPFVTTLHASNTRTEEDEILYDDNNDDVKEEENQYSQLDSIEKGEERNQLMSASEKSAGEEILNDVIKRNQPKQELRRIFRQFSDVVKTNLTTVIQNISITTSVKKSPTFERVRPSESTVNIIHSKGNEERINEGAEDVGLTSFTGIELQNKDSGLPQLFSKNQQNQMETESIDKQFTKKFLFRHSFFLVFTLVILAYSEDDLIHKREYDVNLWYIIFEMISAYGSVGLSFGIPGKSYSLSGQMSTLGKCCIIFIMYLGKHRGLPNSNDEVIDFTFEKFRNAYLNDDLPEKVSASDKLNDRKLKLLASTENL